MLMKPKVGIEIEAFFSVQNKFGLRLVARKEIAWRKHFVRIAIDAWPKRENHSVVRCLPCRCLISRLIFFFHLLH